MDCKNGKCENGSLCGLHKQTISMSNLRDFAARENGFNLKRCKKCGIGDILLQDQIPTCNYCEEQWINSKAAQVLDARANAVRVEPAPIPNALPAAWDLVMADMKARDDFGKAKYNTRLQPFNGRDQLSDAYQEALDLCVYLRNALYERDGR